MTTPTVAVTVDLSDFGGAAVAGITVKCRLNENDSYSGETILAGTTTQVTNGSGVATFDLFPNHPTTGLGTTGSAYRFTARRSGRRVLDETVQIPNSACSLSDILAALAPAQSVAQAAQAAAIANAALTAADRVQTGLDRTATGQDRTQTGLDRVATGEDRAAAEQSAFDAAADLASLIPEPVQVSASRDLAASDFGKTLACSTALTLTIQSGLPAGFSCVIEQSGAGKVTVAAGAGVTVRNVDSHVKTGGQYAIVGLVNVASETYNLAGSTSA